MNALRRLVVLGALALVALPAAAQGPADLTGAYRVNGMNADGSTYSGTAQVTQVGAAVTINWLIAGSGFSGAGIREGRVVTVNWGDANPVVYVVMPTGELHGTWAGGTALDKLTPAR